TLVHDILDKWHKARVTQPLLPIAPFAAACFAEARVHPLFRALWQPRLMAALETFATMIDSPEHPGRTVLASEYSGAMQFDGAKVIGRVDRIDRMADGTLAIVDYKTGTPPGKPQVKAGYALQLGILGLIAQHGKFERDGNVVTGTPTRFEYWSLGKEKNADTFGYWQTPMKEGSARSGLLPDEYLPFHAEKLSLAIRQYIKGREPFTARENPDYKGYNEYDQLMRLDEWLVRLAENEGAA
ncbi:MAG: double-strand break repair protein AddB, partial [Erythrobacter sp.]|nr:double-strand break repair protein AddB [Erythrobacter sp.]